MNPPAILIASRIPPGPVGGLANYQRLLGRELESRSLAKVTCSPGTEPAPWVRKAWMSMASRAGFHGFLERWITSGLPTDRFQAVHFVGTGWDFLGFAARKLGARFTVWPAVHPGQWGDDQIDLRLYKSADVVFCQSHHEANHLAGLGLDPARITLSGLPPMCLPDGNGARLRNALGIGGRPVVLFVGNRIESKGYPALLAAWEMVLKEHPDAVLLLAGSGGQGDLTSRSIRDLGLADERDKADAYAACDIFCLPSAHESFGIVYVEAWSYGKPVICGPAPASRELVRNGETGLHSDQTPEGIAAALKQLLGDSAARIRMGEAGRDFQRKNLTWDVVTATHARAFQIPEP